MNEEQRGVLRAELPTLELVSSVEAGWDQWIAELPVEELADEATVLSTLRDGPSGAAACMGTYWRHLIARQGWGVPSSSRVLLARAIAQKRLADAALWEHVEAFQDAEGDAEAVGALNAALQTLTHQPSLADCAATLRSVLRGIPAALWPEGIPRADEPTPSLGVEGNVQLATELIEVVETPAHKERLQHAVDREREIRPDMAGSSLRPQATRIAAGLAEDADPADRQNACTRFVRALAEGLRRHDTLREMKKRKKTPSTGVRRVLVRRDGGKLGRLHLVELEDGQLGLLYKPRFRYVWLEGSREEMLATIPDRWFEDAVHAAMES